MLPRCSLILLAALAMGCGDDAGTAGSSDGSSTGADGSTTTPTGPTSDTSGVDGTSSTSATEGESTQGESSADSGSSSSTGAGSSSTGEGFCAAPDPIVAGTPETDAIADAPARCGMPEYQWLESDELGDVGEFGDPSTFAADFIDLAAAASGLTLPGPAEYDVNVEQFIYTTQDRGELIEATSLIAYPEGPDPKDPAPVILVLHGSVGATDQCSPSLTDDARAIAAIFATYGYIVVAPDYLGLKGLGDPTGFTHPYLVGEATAIASLDALRALRKLPEERRGGLCPATEFAYWGASQGGHAALWIDRLAPYYAREFTALGGVAAIPPADVLGEMQRALTTSVSATGNTIGFFGSSADWYGHEDNLDDVFVAPLDVDIPAALAASCDPEDALGLSSDTPLDEIFVQPLLDAVSGGNLVDYDWLGCMTQESSIPDTSIPRIESELPSYGILNIFGEDDSLVDTATERAAYEELCEAGMPYDYLECAGAGHTDAAQWSVTEAVNFIDDRVNGVPFEAPDTCVPPAAVTCAGTP